MTGKPKIRGGKPETISEASEAIRKRMKKRGIVFKDRAIKRRDE